MGSKKKPQKAQKINWDVWKKGLFLKIREKNRPFYDWVLIQLKFGAVILEWRTLSMKLPSPQKNIQKGCPSSKKKPQPQKKPKKHTQKEAPSSTKNPIHKKYIKKKPGPSLKKTRELKKGGPSFNKKNNHPRASLPIGDTWYFSQKRGRANTKHLGRVQRCPIILQYSAFIAILSQWLLQFIAIFALHFNTAIHCNLHMYIM